MKQMRAASLGLTLFVGAPAAIMTGCAILHHDQRDERFAVDLLLQRETELRSKWRGRPYPALVSAYGPPNLFMDVPGRRALKTSVAVYGVRSASVRCIDAFTIVVLEKTGEIIVADYFCR
jgi:hypothetical protein